MILTRATPQGDRSPSGYTHLEKVSGTFSRSSASPPNRAVEKVPDTFSKAGRRVYGHVRRTPERLQSPHCLSVGGGHRLANAIDFAPTAKQWHASDESPSCRSDVVVRLRCAQRERSRQADPLNAFARGIRGGKQLISFPGSHRWRSPEHIASPVVPTVSGTTFDDVQGHWIALRSAVPDTDAGTTRVPGARHQRWPKAVARLADRAGPEEPDGNRFARNRSHSGTKLNRLLGINWQRSESQAHPEAILLCVVVVGFLRAQRHRGQKSFRSHAPRKGVRNLFQLDRPPSRPRCGKGS